MDLPTGTVTFLFTDIEGSTRLWEEHPEPMRKALARHDALAASIIELYGGTLVKSRGEGDSLFAVFARATDALAAACALQQAFHAERWPTGTPLRVRMALHTGEADLRDGDYYGPAVNRCARLRAIGHGGQILLSRTTYDLVRDALPEGASLQDAGEQRLRDLARPEHVFQLLHPDLPSEFPPLRSLDSPILPNNLPEQLTSFIGREKEIAEVRRLLGKTRLLTLTGSGGCGKTRLALQVAAEVLEECPEGVWLVELASLADPGLVPQAVAQALNVTEEPGKPPTQTLAQALKSRNLLLVLDNCEHLLPACAGLADMLLRACPHVRLLATSRERLNVGGETAYRVPSLSLPDPTGPVALERLSQYEAVRLFIERAEAAVPAFAVTKASAPALARACHRLDGIPLAIELAAARVRSLSVEEINTRLDDRFRLLTGGSRTALPRQQTLRALIDWSYDLLTEPEKALLCRLSVFAGGWTLEAAEAVCGGSAEQPGSALSTQHSALDILDLLTSLADKSLVLAEMRGDATRYRLLETVRQYAQERLAQTEEGASVRDRHRDYFLALAEEADSKLRGSEQAVWLERLETEHDNLRVASAWCTHAEAGAEAGLRLAVALGGFWDVRGYRAEGLETLKQALERGADAPATLRARALHVAGSQAQRLGEYGQAGALLEASLTLRRELGDKSGIAGSVYGLGGVAYWQGDYASARTLYEESLAICRELGDKFGISIGLNNLGMVASAQGDYASGRTLYEESLEIYRELGNKRGVAMALLNLGSVTAGQGDYSRAEALIEESLVGYREVGDRGGIALSLYYLGEIARKQGDCSRAEALIAESVALWREIGEQNFLADALVSAGRVALMQGDRARARALGEESLAILQAVGDPGRTVVCMDLFAYLAMGQGKTERSARLWGATEALRESIGLPLPPGEREEYERQIAVAREALGEAAFAAAWEAGRTVTLEQAVAYALEESGEHKGIA